MSFRTAQDIAEELRISPSLVSKLVASGRLRGYRIGRCLRITDEALEEYLTGVVTECHLRNDVIAPAGSEAANETPHGAHADTTGKSASKSEGGGYASLRAHRLAGKLRVSNETDAPTTTEPLRSHQRTGEPTSRLSPVSILSAAKRRASRNPS